MFKNTMEGLKQDRENFEEKHPKLATAGKWICRGLVAGAATVAGIVTYKAISCKGADLEWVDLDEVDANDLNNSGDENNQPESETEEEA